MTSAQPIPWSKWKKYFKSADGGVVREVTKDAFAVHYWNRMRLDSKVAYILDKSHLLGGLYFAKTDSAKSENLYRNVVNRTLPNQETDKPYSAKSYSGIC